MRAFILAVPAVGILMAASVPLGRYIEKTRDEAGAIAALTQIRHAQRVIREQSGGYATDVASLVTPCAGAGAALDPAALDGLAGHGFRLRLRPAAGARPLVGRDCHGAPLAADYYAAVEPVSAMSAGQQAFAARADGDIFVFYDGIAPDEASMANGLATPLAQRSTFRIP